MNFGQQLLFFFSALGTFNGFILGIYLLLFKRSKSAASYFLGLLLLALSIRITKAIFGYFYHDLHKVYLQIGLSGCFLIGPSLYYFTKAALGNVQRTPVRWKYIYVGWAALITVVGIIIPYSRHPWDWNNYIVHVIYLQWVVYFIFTALELKSVFAKVFSSTERLLPGERPILSIFIANTIILVTYLIVFIWGLGIVYISGAIFFSLLLYLNIPLFVNRKKEDTAFLGNIEPERYTKKKIEATYAERLTDKLRRSIIEQEIYKNPDLKIGDLAGILHISSHQLSQLLNDNLGKSFATYINEYRIDRACELIKNDQGIKLEEIGYAVGFNSKSTFYAAFRKQKGTTPTLYKSGLTGS